MVTILGSAWFPAKPGFVKVRELAAGVDGFGYEPIVGIVLVRVDPPGDLKAYIGLAQGVDRRADEDFIADWGSHFPLEPARTLIGFWPERVKGEQIKAPDPAPLTVWAERLGVHAIADGFTGIYVRAQDPGGNWLNADIAQLDRESLLTWLRSDRGHNPLAERTVLLLLGHELPP